MSRRTYRLVAGSDKFRGTATAGEVAAAIRAAATAHGWQTTVVPVSDGGEGFLDAIADRFESGRFTGPDGSPITARWGWARPDAAIEHTAVLETAEVSGLLLAGGPLLNDPVNATSYGVGEQVVAAIRAGARSAIIGCGGSACTDGGSGMLRAIEDGGGLPDSFQLIAAVDVQTTFTDAARIFAPQKGADADTVDLLTLRLENLAETYREKYGADPSGVPGSGAAGGIAGGVFALGGRITSGFDLAAELFDLPSTLKEADLVVTGEGRLDATSLDGKVVGGILGLVDSRVPVLVVTGTATTDAVRMVRASHPDTRLASLEEIFGLDRAMSETSVLIGAVVADHLASLEARAAAGGPLLTPSDRAPTHTASG
jgi:glycerate 2-kinase